MVMVFSTTFAAVARGVADATPSLPVCVAKIDITPQIPVRMGG